MKELGKSLFRLFNKNIASRLNMGSNSCPVTKFNGRGILTVQR